ncbi:MAG: hypothetical protein HEEMFOPI_01115 [Holosporales bacterium]
MKKAHYILLTLSFLRYIFAADESVLSYSKNIQQVSEGLHAGRMERYPELHIVCEKITPENKLYWINYAGVQSQSRIPLEVKKNADIAESLLSQKPQNGEEDETSKQRRAFYEAAYKKQETLLSLRDGSSFFLRSLLFNKGTINNLWVVYITSGKPQEIPASITTYENPYGDPHAFAKDIKMFTTLIIGPKITTHMGIASSIENILHTNRYKGISPDLHSFCAKFALMINPEVVYQINEPDMQMREILLRKLPEKALSFGDIDTLERYELITFECFISDDFDHPSVRAEKEKESDEPLESRLFKLYREFQKDLGLDMMRKYKPIVRLSQDAQGYNKVEIHSEKLNQVIERGDPQHDWLFNGICFGFDCPIITIDIKTLAALTSLAPLTNDE